MGAGARLIAARGAKPGGAGIVSIPQVVGTIESLWRYPVKSMAGEALSEAFIGYAGVYGDRAYAFLQASAPPGFPYLTGRERRDMLLCRPRFRNPEIALRPPNQPAALALADISPVYPEMTELGMDVELPSGKVLAIHDPGLVAAIGGQGGVSVVRSHRAMTDCRPVSMISTQTIRQLGEEVAMTLDKRRFRANVYARFEAAEGFQEDGFVGRRLQLGERAVVAVLERDSRCKMVTIDPDTAMETPQVMRNIARGHDGNAGVYCAVMTEGVVRPNDPIVLLD
jgi:hypothetical protein